jgi:Flp pilus assembly protein TadD
MSGLHSRTKLLQGSLAVALLAAALGGCRTTQPTASVELSAAVPPARPDAERRSEVDAAGARYRADPGNPTVAIRYAQALRSIGERTQAVAVLEQAAIKQPKDYTVLGAYGRALADAGNYDQAFDVLSRAHTPDQPDWRILSVQGAALDQMGRHDEARRYYASALKLKPDDPSVLSNLGLSYALSKDLAQAESTLRRAVAQPGADPRVRQNLALVVGLEGRFADAEGIARADLPPDEAAANITYLRQMLAQQSPVRRAAKMDGVVAASQ